MAVGLFIFVISNRRSLSDVHKIPNTIFSKSFYMASRYRFIQLMKTPFDDRKNNFEAEKERIEKEIEEQAKTDR